MRIVAQAPNSLCAGEGGYAAAHSASPSKHFWKVRVAIAASPGWASPLSSLLLGDSRGLWVLEERKTNGFNVYHSKVQCHGNPGTPDSPLPLGGCPGQDEQRANTLPWLPAPPVFWVCVGAGG